MELQYLLQEKYGDYNSSLIDVNYSRFINTLKQKSKIIKNTKIQKKSDYESTKLQKELNYNIEELLINYTKKLYNMMNGVISTQINYKKNEFPLYLLGMDCDNIDDKNKATLELTSRNINHISMVSSIYPSHFWIVADYVGNIEECISMMDKIPGVDKKFIDICAKRKTIVFRAFPKENSGLPIFPFLNNACSISLTDWYLKFQNYWESEDIKEIFANISSNKPLVSEKQLDIITSTNEWKNDFSNLDL